MAQTALSRSVPRPGSCTHPAVRSCWLRLACWELAPKGQAPCRPPTTWPQHSLLMMTVMKTVRAGLGPQKWNKGSCPP